MAKMWAVMRMAVAMVAVVSLTRAQFCVNDYNVTVPLVQPDGYPLEVSALFITKLTNVQLVWTEGDKDEPIQLAAYTSDPIYDITDAIRTTMATDQENLGTLQLDAKEEMELCLYIIIPMGASVNKLTVEGMAEVNVGPMVDIEKFTFVVNNGYIRGGSEMFVDDLDLVVKGNGAIMFEPSASNVVNLNPSVIGSGNVTFDGSVVSVQVEVQGEGVVVVGTVLYEVELDLEGREANVTIITRDSRVKVKGDVEKNNYVTLVGGASCSKVETSSKSTCKTASKLPSNSKSSSLALAGK